MVPAWVRNQLVSKAELSMIALPGCGADRR